MCINLYTYQQRLAYAKRIQQLQQAVVIKDNIHLTYKYKNQNKTIANAHSLQDKIIKSIVDNAVSGNADSIKNIDSQVEKLLNTTLENERKRIHNKKDRYIDNAVEQNSAKYSKILTNRINQEAFKLESKIESEIRSGIHKKLTEAETRQELLNKYGDTGKARIKNIIRDSIHTNESNISFIDALSKGYNYKVWMNGRGKGKTRPWHKANIITSVPIEEYFDIYGSYHAQLMYPGDLYGGAENVANCICWLRYTNKVPENLKKKTAFNVNPSYQNIWDKTKNVKNTFNISSKFHELLGSNSKITKNFKNRIVQGIKNIFSWNNNDFKYNPKTHSYNIPKNYIQFRGKTNSGLLPNREKISKYFSKNVSLTNKYNETIYLWAYTNLDKRLRTYSKQKFKENKIIKFLRYKNISEHFIPVYIKDFYQCKLRMEELMKDSYIKVNMVLHRQQDKLFLGDNPKIGEVIKWDSYNSTSISNEGVHHYENFVGLYQWTFTILAPKGTRGVYIAPKVGGKYAPEMEFILDRHNKMKILDINYHTHTVLLKVIV